MRQLATNQAANIARQVVVVSWTPTYRKQNGESVRSSSHPPEPEKTRLI
jgi:hypothetical protein